MRNDMKSLCRWVKGEWAKLSATRKRLDLAEAVLMRELIDRSGGDVALARSVLVEALGFNGSQTERAYAMATALTVVTDKETWLQVGWDGVRLLVGIKRESDRAAVLSESKRRAAETGRPTSSESLKAIIEKVQPGSSKLTRERSVSGVPRPEHPAQTRDKLAADLLAVLKVYPKARALLSAETVKYLGIDATPAAPDSKRPTRSLVGAI